MIDRNGEGCLNGRRAGKDLESIRALGGLLVDFKAGNCSWQVACSFISVGTVKTMVRRTGAQSHHDPPAVSGPLPLLRQCKHEAGCAVDGGENRFMIRAGKVEEVAWDGKAFGAKPLSEVETELSLRVLGSTGCGFEAVGEEGIQLAEARVSDGVGHVVVYRSGEGGHEFSINERERSVGMGLARGKKKESEGVRGET